MREIREWSYPVVLILTWMVTVAYTLSLMTITAPNRTGPGREPPSAVEQSRSPSS